MKRVVVGGAVLRTPWAISTCSCGDQHGASQGAPPRPPSLPPLPLRYCPSMSLPPSLSSISGTATTADTHRLSPPHCQPHLTPCPNTSTTQCCHRPLAMNQRHTLRPCPTSLHHPASLHCSAAANPPPPGAAPQPLCHRHHRRLHTFLFLACYMLEVFVQCCGKLKFQFSWALTGVHASGSHGPEDCSPNDVPNTRPRRRQAQHASLGTFLSVDPKEFSFQSSLNRTVRNTRLSSTATPDGDED